ncbi:MAG: carboxypeptidase-like regulatory domain-containing protein, partial [Fimbriimonadaceae bacterium]|nr:carboxypeptidase-like regulatory domain-containing protein [Chitinophagales bacterium]
MRYAILVFSFLFVTLLANAQTTTIKGTITANKKETVPGANIILKDTYDGTTSDLDGNFSFVTEEKGKQILIVTFVGFEDHVDTLELNGGVIEKNIVLKEKFNELNAVVISAGAFEASDEKKNTILKPLDIVTTAGAEGDIYGALETLPGASKVGNDDGLYVRGGSDYETKTIIDGMIVNNPYYTTTPDVPSRGRFQPFLFKGTVFSTGGYSAE